MTFDKPEPYMNDHMELITIHNIHTPACIQWNLSKGDTPELGTPL